MEPTEGGPVQNDRMVKIVVWAVVVGMVLSLVFVVIASI
jgi:hypothetical protein